MSDSAGVLSVEINGKDVNLSALLERIEQQLQKADATGKRTGESLGSSVGAGAQRGASGALSLQQALSRLDVQEAKLARAQGDTARAAEFEAQAEERLRSALAQVDTTTVQTVNAQRQLANIQTQNATGGAGLTSIFGQMGGTLGRLATAAGPVAAGFVAIEGARKVIDFAKSGADADLARQSFDQLAQQAGTTGEALLGALRKASKNEISDLNLELAANRAQLLGVASSAQQFSGLMEIARDRAQKMGISTTQAFNDLVTGLGRGSPLILDNLGITLNVAEANETYAKSLGKTAAQLSEAEKKQALINAVLAQGQASLAAGGGAADTAAGSYARLAAAWDNVKTGMASAAGNALAPAAEGAARLMNMGQEVDALGPKVLNSAKSWDEYTAKLKATNDQLGQLTSDRVDGLSQAQFNYARSLMQTGTAADEAFAKSRNLQTTFQSIGAVQLTFRQDALGSEQALDQLANAMLRTAAEGAEGAAFVEGLTSAFLDNRISAEQMSQALAQHAVAAAQSTAATAAHTLTMDAERSAVGAAQVATQQYNAQLGATAAQALTAQANSQALAAAQAAIANIASAAANGLISDANAAGVLASQYGIATGEAMTLINAQRQLAQAKADATLAQLKAAPASNTRRDLEDERAARADAARQERAQAAARRSAIDADLAYDRANTAEKLRLTREELAGVSAYSAQWVALKKREQSLQSSLNKSGGAAKLSDQQKLNGALLADQEQFADKFDDADLKHAQNRLKIQQDFYKKLQDAQDKFDSDQLAGRASFYDNIGQIESDKIRKSASAAYESAALEAGKIAQEKGADVADKYMAAQERIIQARAKRQADIEAAAKSGDKGKAENLRGVDELYRKSEEDQLKRITEANDSIAAQRDQAMAEENRAYEEQTGKIADSADRAAERKILAAERAGKALDTEQLKLDRLASTYDRIAPGGGAPAQASPAPQPTPTPAAAATPAEGVPLAQALDALSAAVGAVERAVRDSGRGVEGAVRGLAGRMAA